MNSNHRQEIINAIHLVKDVTDVEISDKTSLIDDLGFDSVSMINFISIIEDKFNLKFDENDDIVEIFYSIESLLKYLESVKNG